MLTLKGDTIYYDGYPVAWLTIPNGTLRGQVEAALDDLPDVTPLAAALGAFEGAQGIEQLAATAAALAYELDTWLKENRDHISETLPL